MFPPPPPPAPAVALALPHDGAKRDSLEEFLARARARQAEVFARLGQEVEGLVKRIEALTLPASGEARDSLIAECLALGPEATPLFVPWLDPGDSGLEKERFRAAQIVQVLLRVDTRAATGELLELAARGSRDGRLRAVQVLENTSEPERVRPVLLEAFRGSQGALREALLRASLRLAPRDGKLLDEVLAGDEPALREVALAAVTEARNAEAEERVRRLLADPEKGPQHATAALAYYQAMPELVESAQLKELLALVNNGSVAATARLEILESLPRFVTTANNELKKALDPILNGSDPKLSETARIVLARLGNKAAERELLKPYDEMVDGSPAWSQPYVRRADILRRIGNYREAEKDYKKALEQSQNEGQPQPETHIGLARCYALQGKYKDAQTVLNKAPVPIAKLKALGNDPDFAKMALTKYGDVFRRD